MTKHELRQRYEQDLQTASAEAQRWTQRVFQLQGALAAMNEMETVEENPHDVAEDGKPPES